MAKIMVVATREGYYGNQRRHPEGVQKNGAGKPFELLKPSDFSANWMQVVEGNIDPKIQEKAEQKAAALQEFKSGGEAQPKSEKKGKGNKGKGIESFQEPMKAEESPL